MVDRGLTLAVLPPSPAKAPPSPTPHEAARRRHRLARPPTRRQVERRAQRLCSLLRARAIRAGVIFSSAMHGRRYSRREQSGPDPEERVAAGKKKVSGTHGRVVATVTFDARRHVFCFLSRYPLRLLSRFPLPRPRKAPETERVNGPDATFLEEHGALLCPFKRAALCACKSCHAVRRVVVLEGEETPTTRFVRLPSF